MFTILAPGLFSLERRRREAHCSALRIWRHCHNIDVKLIPLLTDADQLMPAECKNHSDTTDYCHIVTCHRVITHGAEELWKHFVISNTAVTKQDFLQMLIF